MEDEGFTVEEGVPTPPDKRRWPFRCMEVGDSFLVPKGSVSKNGEPTTMGRVTSAAASYTHRIKAAGRTVRFTCRKVPEGIRVWRVE